MFPWWGYLIIGGGIVIIVVIIGLVALCLRYKGLSKKQSETYQEPTYDI